MKIDRPMISNIPDSITEKTDTTGKVPGSASEQAASGPVQLQRIPLPKTDTVEMKKNSFYNFDNNAPKLDPSQQNISAKGFAAGMLPGVPFREKVELPKNLPNGSSIDSGLAKGDLGFGKTSTRPNHMGIDMKVGGTEIRNQLNDALALKEGSTSQSAPTGSSQKTEGKYESQFNRPGTELKAGGFGDFVNGVKDWVKGLFTPSGATDVAVNVALEKFGPPAGAGEAMTLLNAPAVIQSVTGDATDGLRGVVAFGTETRGNDLLNKVDEGNKYINPDGGPGVDTQLPNLTPEEAARLANSRKIVNTTPSNTDDAAPITIDPKRVYDPLKDPLVTDGNPDLYESSVDASSPEHLTVSGSAKGPDTVNPNDPDLGSGGDPIVIDPNRPK